MNKKFRMTIRDLILSSKDYSDFTKDELITQHEIIMNQYDKFKNEMTSNADSRIISTNIVNIKNNQRRVQQNMFSKMLNEVDSHLKIIEDLITSL
jgi:hypothetical protein